VADDQTNASSVSVIRAGADLAQDRFEMPLPGWPRPTQEQASYWGQVAAGHWPPGTVVDLCSRSPS
jgi:hypothetical protein